MKTGAFVILGMLCVAQIAFAKDPAEDKDVNNMYKRKMTFSNSAKAINCVSMETDADSKSKLHMGANMNDGILKFRVMYVNRNGDTKSALKFGTRMKSIVEFDPTVVDPYVGGAAVSTYDFADQTWSDFTSDSAVVDGVTVKTYSTSTTDNVVTAKFTFTDLLAEEADVTLTPTSMKLDLTIDFPYTQDGTKLALVTKIDAKNKMQTRTRSGESEEGVATHAEKEVQVEGGGFLSWVEKCTVAGVETSVVTGSATEDSSATSEETDEKTASTYFIIDTTSHGQVVWDPKVGVVGVEDDDDAASFSTPALALISAALAVAFV